MEFALSEGIRCWRSFVRVLIGLAAITLSYHPFAHSRITKIVVPYTRQDPWPLAGRIFGTVGEYERVQGLAYGELDPADPHNDIIQDLGLAPRNIRGKVEYVVTFTLLKPVHQEKGSGILLYEVVNRGASILPNRYESGDVFLISGWQGDLPFGGKSIYGTDGETILVPTAKNLDGSSITGPILARFTNVNAGLNTLPLRSAIGYATSGVPPLPVDPDTKHARLTTRPYEGVSGSSSPVVTVMSEDWAWADCSERPFPGEPDPQRICVRQGFNPSLLYQLEYTGKDPLVLGVGLAAIRDLISFFRNAIQDDEGWKNPLAGKKIQVIGRGASQAGNTLRTFLNLGFNQDEGGRIVLDGAMSIIAARQTPINYRFAIPGGAAGLQELGSDGIVWWSDWPDAARGRPKAGLLDRCRESHTCPRIVEVLGSSEFWSLRASAGFVGTGGGKDIPLPPEVRRYYIASTQHGGGEGGFHLEPVTSHSPGAVPTSSPIVSMPCVLPTNPNPMTEITKALLVALEQWIAKGEAPPASSYPTLADNTLVAPTVDAMGFPRFSLLPSPEGVANPLLVYDLGEDFQYNDLSGIVTYRPAAIKEVIPAVVPRVDGDGNEVAGVHTVLQQAALGTYLGWNVTAGGFYKGQYCSLSGGYVPFHKTKMERLSSFDPRLSLEERYGTQRGYVCVASRAAEDLLRERLLLPEDAEALVTEAAASSVLPDDAMSTKRAIRIADERCRREIR